MKQYNESFRIILRNRRREIEKSKSLAFLHFLKLRKICLKFYVCMFIINYVFNKYNI